MRVQAIRIGAKNEDGLQRVACSLELVAEHATQPAALWVDWEVHTAVAGFIREQAAVWCACRRDGVASGVRIDSLIEMFWGDE